MTDTNTAKTNYHDKEIHAGSTGYLVLRVCDPALQPLGRVAICADRVPPGSDLEEQHDYWSWSSEDWPAATFRLYPEPNLSVQASDSLRYQHQTFPPASTSMDFTSLTLESGDRFYVVSHANGSGNDDRLAYLHVKQDGVLDWYSLSSAPLLPHSEEGEYLEFEYRDTPPGEARDVFHLPEIRLS